METTNRYTVASILYNPFTYSRPSNEQDRVVAETISGEIVLSRDSISNGSVVRANNSAHPPVILKKNGSPIDSSTLNSDSTSKVLGARSILFEPKGWNKEVISDATSPIGYNLYIKSTSENELVDIITFDEQGEQVSTRTLGTEELLTAEVRENLDLNQDNNIGGAINETLFNPQSGGSDRRYVLQTTKGIVVSREHLSDGTDLKTRNIVSDRNSGPGLLG